MKNQLSFETANAPKTIKVSVPMEEQAHRELTAAAALAGLSKPEYVRQAIREKLEREKQERQE